MVVDIYGLNAITKPDAYLIFIKANIISDIQNYSYITVIDYFFFVYKWYGYLDHWHQLTLVTHKSQEIFHIAVMRYKNLITYVQCQMDRLLWP